MWVVPEISRSAARPRMPDPPDRRMWRGSWQTHLKSTERENDGESYSLDSPLRNHDVKKSGPPGAPRNEICSFFCSKSCNIFHQNRLRNWTAPADPDFLNCESRLYTSAHKRAQCDQIVFYVPSGSNACCLHALEIRSHLRPPVNTRVDVRPMPPKLSLDWPSNSPSTVCLLSP